MYGVISPLSRAGSNENIWRWNGVTSDMSGDKDHASSHIFYEEKVKMRRSQTCTH
jgi:hypothetical protein